MQYGGLVKFGRVFLRDLAEEDLVRTHEWIHRPDINDRIGVRIPFTLEMQQRWYSGMVVAKGKYVFAICRIDDGAHVGNVSIDSIDIQHGHGRISIFIADKEERGKGLGSDALQALMKFAFNELRLHRVWCKTNADEEGLRNFYTKNGFSLEGRLVQHEMHCGRYVDKWVFGMVKS